MSNEKNVGWLFDIGDDKRPTSIGIILNHYKDPGSLLNNQKPSTSLFLIHRFLLKPYWMDNMHQLRQVVQGQGLRQVVQGKGALFWFLVVRVLQKNTTTHDNDMC